MIRTVEECSLNAWPAPQQLWDDGWLLRLAAGYTKRANSVNVLHPSREAVEAKIQRCINIYQNRRLPVVFRITPLAQADDLDRRLAEQGFESHSPTRVQLLSLASLPPPAAGTFQVWTEFSTGWANHFAQFYPARPNRAAHEAILRAIIPPTCFALLKEGERVVACGLGVLERDYFGLFDIITAEAERRQGFGRSLVLHLLHWAKARGASQAYLQVEATNTPALNLYRKLGFTELYQYWYRVLPQ